MSLLDDILGRNPKEKEEPDTGYRIMMGPCTKLLHDVVKGKLDASLPQRFKSKARIVKCEGCGLLDCWMRKSAKDDFQKHGRCPECGGKQVRYFK